MADTEMHLAGKVVASSFVQVHQAAGQRTPRYDFGVVGQSQRLKHRNHEASHSHSAHTYFKAERPLTSHKQQVPM